MKTTAQDLLRRLPSVATPQYPGGEPFITAFAHGSMSVEMYAPVAIDIQEPHAQDELYIVHCGTGTILVGTERHTFAPGACFFVAAGVEHRFEDFSEDFATWVVFWGPEGGER